MMESDLPAMIEDNSLATCWTLIRDAAAGELSARDRFARMYEPAVRAYLSRRWRSKGSSGDLDDAVQDFFVECFRDSGFLHRAEPGHPGGFRAFLYGVMRNIARRREGRRADHELPAEILDDESALSAVFDREIARSLMREASRVQLAAAHLAGPSAERRHELLRLRFQENLPIREIAKLWQVDPAWLHHEYARARDEFRSALKQTVRFNHPDCTDSEIDQQCQDLLSLL